MARSWGPSPQRWSEFSLTQQIIMISNELSRAGNWTSPGDETLRRDAYARALVLTDLTASGNHRLEFRRELLRWRDVLAQLYLEREPQPKRNAELLRSLLLFTFETSRQIPYLVPSTS